MWDVDLFGTPEKMVVARKYILAILCIFCAASGLIKISILLFYRRLSSRVVSNRFRWATWLTIGFIAMSTFGFTIAPIVGCNPISAFWDQVNAIKIVKGYKFRCFDEGADIFAASVISAFQDLITAMLPSFLYWNLRVPIRQKIALFGIFAIGYGVAILGALRAYYNWQIYYETYDITWATWDAFIVTILELHVGCFCANAPTFKVFFKHFFREKLASSIKRSNRPGHKGRVGGTQSSKSSAGTLKEKVSFLFSKGSSNYSRDGYISEAHADISVDAHGGVHVQRDFVVEDPEVSPVVVEPTDRDIRESVDTTDLFCAQHYDDIEMGRFTTGRNSQVSSVYTQETDLEALPAMPSTPRSPRSMKSLMAFNRQSRSPQVSRHSDWPASPLPAAIAEERLEDGSRTNLSPSHNPNLQKPHWQSWT